MLRSLPCLLLLLALLAPSWARSEGGPKVLASLVAETTQIAPGGQITVAVQEDIAEGWHTYWRNPGTAGAPTAVNWQLPPGWKASELQWPYPKRLVTAGLVDYGYEGRVWLLSRLTAPAQAKSGTVVSLKAHVSWLVCKEICIPEETDVALLLTIDPHPSAPYATTADGFAAAAAKLPAPAPWPVRYARQGKTVALFLASPQIAAAAPRAAEFFPLDPGMIVDAAPQDLGLADNGAVLRLTRAARQHGPLRGVVVLTSRDGSVQPLEVAAQEGPVPKAEFVQTDIGLPLAIAFALLGGLILNLMPCVLPVLAIKALSVARNAQVSRAAAARDGLAYGLGCVLSFVALGAIAALLRAGGEEVGWGFQLQSPAVVASFALLFFAVGLSLSGLFELPGFSGGGTLAGRGGTIGAFFTGVLAVAVAAPCTAPFMAAALGFALTQNTAAALLVFAALGMGFAAPFVAISLSPALLRALPKPGAWMQRLREALAFPMYGAAAWLVWVLTQEAGPQGLIAVLGAMIAFAFAAWVWRASRSSGPVWRAIGAGVAVLALLAALACLAGAGASQPPPRPAGTEAPGALHAQAYSPELLATLRGQHRPVFVDVTAAWCITCLVNEKAALSAPEVAEAFAKNNVAYLVADWTSRDDRISKLLAAHRRSGVPLYLYYPPGADAQILPQILTADEILSVVQGR